MQLNLTGHCNGLTTKEIKDLWTQADIDGNGLVDYKEFQVKLFNVIISYVHLDIERDLECLSLKPSQNTHTCCSLATVTYCSKEYGTRTGQNREI